MALSSRERQRAWAARRNTLARTAEALQQHDAELFERLKKQAEKLWTAKLRQRRKRRAA